MRERTLVLSVVLAAFTAFSAYVVWEHGVIGLMERCFDNSATTLAFVDMTIALTLVMVWMWGDAKDRGVSPVPYVVLTLMLGSVGPLLYLIRRDLGAPAPRAAIAHGVRVS